MIRLITRGKFTGSHIKGLLEAPEDREPAVRKLVEAAGGKLIGFYFTTGDHDFMLIAEAPDAESLDGRGDGGRSTRHNHRTDDDPGVDGGRIQTGRRKGGQGRGSLPCPRSGTPTGRRRLVGLTTRARTCARRLRPLSPSRKRKRHEPADDPLSTTAPPTIRASASGAGSPAPISSTGWNRRPGRAGSMSAAAPASSPSFWSSAARRSRCTASTRRSHSLPMPAHGPRGTSRFSARAMPWRCHTAATVSMPPSWHW